MDKYEMIIMIIIAVVIVAVLVISVTILIKNNNCEKQKLIKEDDISKSIDRVIIDPGQNGLSHKLISTIVVNNTYNIGLKRLILKRMSDEQIIQIDILNSVAIGRGSSGNKEGTICVSNDPGVSRCHCIIKNHDGLIYIEDNNSRNHTYVNNQIITSETAIKSGDSICLGKNERFYVI